MSEFATLRIVNGDFERGFRVILRTGRNENSTVAETDGWLPPASDLPQLFENWQLNYHPGNINFDRALKAPKEQVTNCSITESANRLKDGINSWLNSGDEQFRPFRDQLIGHLHNHNRVKFIIQTDNVQLWRLPWHLWQVLEDCQVEVHLSASAYQQVARRIPVKSKPQVRILVILGDSTGINIAQDLKLLEQELPNAKIVPLRNPKKEDLSDQLWEQKWDILFFAGHSSSQGANFQGKFYISKDESLTIEELKSALNNAIEHGLKLAIFNSCDGLGLGRELAGLQIPATIVMRERIPDEIAQKFLAYFLRAFAQKGKSLSAAIREARKRLGELEEENESAYKKFREAKQQGNPEAWNNEAFYEIQKGNYQKADNLLRKSLGESTSKENEYAIRKNLGWALWEQGKNEEAEAHLRSAIELELNHGSAYCLLAQVLEARSEQADSLVQWNNCLDYASSSIPEEAKWIDMAQERIEAEQNEP